MRFTVKAFFYTLVFVIFLLIVALGLEVAYKLSGKYPIAGIQPDKYELWKWRGGLDMQSQNPELGAFRLLTDGKGFRNTDKDYSRVKNAGTVRILVIGDSFTAGLAYPSENIYTTLLQQYLQAATNKKVEVYNMASPAWSTEQQYMCLVNEGLQIQPDYVLLMTCPNDIREVYCKKYAVVQNGKIRFNASPFNSGEVLGWKLSNYSCFYQYLQRKVFYTDYGSFHFLMSKFDFTFSNADSTWWDRPLFARQSTAELDAAYSLYHALVSDMQAACKQHKAEMAVACVPFIMEYNQTMQQDTTLQRGVVQHRIAELCKTQNLPFINLFDAFAANPNPTALFTTDDVHFSSNGFKITADVLADYYKEKVK